MQSSLVARDIDLFRRLYDISVGLSITTDREDVRRIFEPNSPSIQSRIKALKILHDEGVTTYVFIGPMLPLDPGKLFEMLTGIVDEVLIDRLNYSNKVKSVYRKAGFAAYLEDAYFVRTASALKGFFERERTPISIIF